MIGLFSIAPHLVIALPNIASAIVVALTFLKAIAKSKSTHIAMAFKSEKEQSFYLYSSLSPLRARNRNSWKSDNYLGSNT